MRVLTAIAVVVGLGLAQASNAQGGAPSGQITVYGQGNASCGVWVNARRVNNVETEHQFAAWVLGYISGVESGLGTVRFKETDFDGVTAFLDKECGQKPLETVYEASMALVQTLHSGR